MADNQVFINLFSMKDHSKSKRMYFWTAKNSLQRKQVQVLDSIRTLAWALEPPRKPFNLDTLTRSAHLLPMFLLEERFSRALLSPTKCKEQLLSEEIIFTMFLSITDTKRDTEISQCTALLLSLLKKEILLSLDNADLLLKPFTSTCWRWSLMKWLVMLESNLCFFDLYMDLQVKWSI